MRFDLNLAGQAWKVDVPDEELARLHGPLVDEMAREARAKGGRYIVFLAGPPGSGKSTLAALWQMLAAQRHAVAAQALPMDGFHYPNRTLDAVAVTVRGRTLPLRRIKGAPESFDLPAIAAGLGRLANGDPLAWPLYDRRIHEPVADALPVIEAGVVIVEGNHLLLDEPGWRELQDVADLRLFVECPEPLARERVLARHTRGGRSMRDALRHYAFNDRHNRRRVMQRRRGADVLLRAGPGGRLERAATPSGMLWTPPDYQIGDITIVRAGEEYHLFTEQSPGEWVGDTARGFAGARTVGHAVSLNLFEWKELPNCIACGPAGSFDAYSIYHMDVFIHEGKWFMFYTGLDKGGPGEQQSVGLATSPDGVTWEKHPGNPVLRADPRWYESAIPREATYQEKDFGRLWFRDPCVVRLPGGGFGMIVVARDISKHPDVRGCLAWATSDDLIHWVAHPPIYSPSRFHTIETPSIFEHGGRWYVQFMSGPQWGTRYLTTDRYQNSGDFYAVSEDGPTGPYHPPADEIVAAAHEHIRMGASRTVDTPDGQRCFYGWLRVNPLGDDAKPRHPYRMLVPPPRRVRFLDDGRMLVTYNPQIEAYALDRRIDTARLLPLQPRSWSTGDGIRAKAFGGRTLALWPERFTDIVFSTRLRFRHGERAGLVLRADGGRRGWRVVADRRLRRIEFGLLEDDGFLDAHDWDPAEELDLKVVAMGESVEVYAGDRLMLHQVRHREARGQVGLLAERADVEFDRTRLLQGFMRPAPPAAGDHGDGGRSTVTR